MLFQECKPGGCCALEPRYPNSVGVLNSTAAVCQLRTAIKRQIKT